MDVLETLDSLLKILNATINTDNFRNVIFIFLLFHNTTVLLRTYMEIIV